MTTIILFFIVLVVLIISHELGHFTFAKMRGVRVDEFGFGFPPRLFGKKYGETVYSFNLLPFGGFVRIYGEDETVPTEQSSRNFAARSIKDRFWIIFAGVLMNIILAFILFTVGHIIGLPTVIDESERALARDISVQIVEVSSGSPAIRAGIRPGDVIQGFSTGGVEESFSSVADIQSYIDTHQGREIAITLMRGGEELSLHVEPRINPPEGEGAIGIAMVETGIVRSPWYRAPIDGARTTYYVTRATVLALGSFFGNLFVGNIASDVSGPVGIAKYVGEAGRQGFVYVLQITALLSINLAVLNLLPLPALDGGRIFFLLIEKIKGSPLNARMTQVAHLTGFVLLIGLMLVITYRDVLRLFS